MPVSLRDRKAHQIAQIHMRVNHVPQDQFDFQLKVAYAILDSLGIREDAD